MTLATNEVHCRFPIHVLHSGFHRIRHAACSPAPSVPRTSCGRDNCSIAKKEARDAVGSEADKSLSQKISEIAAFLPFGVEAANLAIGPR
jgi:hypothetical protein